MDRRRFVGLLCASAVGAVASAGCDGGVATGMAPQGHDPKQEGERGNSPANKGMPKDFMKDQQRRPGPGGGPPPR
jgi:hypothetical protein